MVLQWKLRRFDWPEFHKSCYVIKKLILVNAGGKYLLKGLKKIHQIETFRFLPALEIANLSFAVSIEYLCFQIVQVSQFDGWKLLPRHLLLLSQPCIAYRRSVWLEEVKQSALSQVTVESKLVSMLSTWTWVLKKLNTTECRILIC